VFEKQPDGDRVAGIAAFEECKDRKRLKGRQISRLNYFKNSSLTLES